MAETEKVKAMVAVAEAEELPKTIVRRIVKDKLSQLSTETDISVLREALQAFSESARIFIHYLSATANDVCRESRRQTINASDVFKALEEIEFPEFVEPLRASLEEFRRMNSVKRARSTKAKETTKNCENGDEGKQARKKSKTTKELPAKNGDKGKQLNRKSRKKEVPAESVDEGKQDGGEGNEEEEDAPNSIE